MRVPHLLIALVLAILFLPATQAAAQDEGAHPDTTEVVELRLVDGSRLIGTIVSETGTELVFRTTGGSTITVPLSQIESRRVVTGQIRDGVFLTRDPNTSRLFFSATGRPVGQGRGYFSTYELFFPFVAYGIADQVTLAGGVSLMPGTDFQFVYFAPKLTLIQTGNAAVSAGVLAGTATGEESDSWGGLMYGVGTFGTDRNALTVGLGFAWGGGEVDDTPLILIGGETQIGRRMKLISENYILAGVEDGLALSGGFRFFGDRLAADLGFFTTPAAWGEGGFPFLPWVGFAVNFGD